MPSTTSPRSATTLHVGVTRKFQFDKEPSGKFKEAYAKSWPKNAKPAALQQMTLEQALTREFPYPAYVVQYAPTPHRLGKELWTTPSALKLLGESISMQIAAFDADVPGHGKREHEQSVDINDWWENEQEKIERLLIDLPNLYIYRSTGGYRILGILPAAWAISSKQGCADWTRKYHAWANFLQRSYQIKVDHLGDWGRLQRVPHDSRDYATITRLECLGDPSNVGFWDPELHNEDWPPLTTVKETRQTTEGDPLLLELVRARGLRCEDRGNGEFDICCPRSDLHSPQAGLKDYPGKTLLYARQGDLGAIWCQSDGCKQAHGTPQSWLKEFSRAEVEAAEKAIGKEKWQPPKEPPPESAEVDQARHILCGHAIEMNPSPLRDAESFEKWAKEKYPELASKVWPHHETPAPDASSSATNDPEDFLDSDWDPTWTFNEGVEWVSRRYFSVADGAKITFYDESDGIPFKLGAKEEFFYELASRRIEVIEKEDGKKPKKKLIPIAPIWISSDFRRHYKRGFCLQSKPDRVPHSTYNLWRGFNCMPVQGDWSLMQSHILNVLANGNEELAEYITKWAAWSVQHPEQVAKVALVFRGGEGIGKGMFCDALINMFGPRHAMRVQHMIHLVGKFNSHLRALCMLFVDEAVAVDKNSEGALKGLISEQSLPIEGKGKDVVPAQNHLHVLLASNEKWVVPAGTGSRRYVVVDVAAHRKGDEEYFNNIGAQMYADGKSEPGSGIMAMLHDLQTMDLKGWHPEKHRVETQALEDQRARSLPPHERYWQSFLEEGSIHPSCCVKVAGETRVTAHKLLDYLSKITNTTATATDMTELFKRSGAQKIKSGGKSTWKMPSLKEARDAWNPKYAWPTDDDSAWNEVEDIPDINAEEDRIYQPAAGHHEAPDF